MMFSNFGRVWIDAALHEYLGDGEEAEAIRPVQVFKQFTGLIFIGQIWSEL